MQRKIKHFYKIERILSFWVSNHAGKGHYTYYA